MERVSRTPRRIKPKKPHPDFPLFPHASGRWCKKIRGKFHYFGPWRNPDLALERYLDTKDDLLAGRTPRAAGDGLDIRGLVNHFLTRKQLQLDAGEITQRTFADYFNSCGRLVAVFGRTRQVGDLAADDFQRLRSSLAKGWGPTTLANEMTRIRVIFNHAYQNLLIDRPVRYGTAFEKPPKRLLRRARLDAGLKMFEATELRAMIEAAPVQVRAMILLATNCGFGNGDCGTLPQSALDLARGWVSYPRPKTAIERRCPLWPETVAALKEAIATRPEPKDPGHAELVFITRYGMPWGTGTKANPISREVKKLTQALGCYRPGRGFYAIRHTFATVGGGSKDQVAVNGIMGHSDPSMAAMYRERIDDSRLVAVVDHVRRWLFELDDLAGDQQEPLAAATTQ